MKKEGEELGEGSKTGAERRWYINSSGDTNILFSFWYLLAFYGLLQIPKLNLRPSESTQGTILTKLVQCNSRSSLFPWWHGKASAFLCTGSNLVMNRSDTSGQHGTCATYKEFRIVLSVHSDLCQQTYYPTRPIQLLEA